MGYIKKKIITNLEYSEKDSLDLLIYFSGEGTTYNGQKVLLPYDANSNNSMTFFPLKDLYEDLSIIQNMSEVGNITLFMDVDFNNPAFEQNIIKKSDMVDDKKKKKKKKKKKNKKLEEPIVILPKELMPPAPITVFFLSLIHI